MRTVLLSAFLFAITTGCGDKPLDTGVDDLDGDGWNADVDCDDDDASIYPGAAEICDGIDNNCDGTVDEDSATDAPTWYQDADGDGWGGDTSMNACEQPFGYVQYSGDCDDTADLVYPGAPEIECDRDYNCDEIIGEVDTDLDGYNACGDNNDCDDQNAAVNPGASEVCDWQDPAPGVDENCDGFYNDWPADTPEEDQLAGGALAYHLDADNDGWGSTTSYLVMCPGEDPAINPDWSPTPDYLQTTGDCDDLNAAVNPDATEVCDGIDNDCDAAIDDDDDSVAADSLLPWYYDDDEDGYGDETVATQACAQPEGYVDNADDCYDSNAAVNPGADEYCNGYDDNCDGTSDESTAVDARAWSIDYDGDGYGSAAYSVTTCQQPPGWVDDSSDCDDTKASVNPAADEICDGQDNDCDGVADEDDAIDVQEWFEDGDGDSYGDPGSSLFVCDPPTGYVAAGDDCDDTSSTISPSANEECNGIDDDCDGTVDNNAVDADTWYLDTDGDGYGLSDSWIEQCEQPTGYAELSSDCDDTNSAISPGASETCDGIDNDCDGRTDEVGAIDAPTWYYDSDGDNFGGTATTTQNCNQPTGYLADATDCNDSDGTINPGADEICNDSVDNNCDGLDTGCVASITNADLRIHGEAASDAAGTKLAHLGDLDGDGTDDLLFSAYWNDTVAADAGSIYLFYGPFSAAGDISASDADVIITGDGADDRAGFDITGGVDITGNGYEDLLIAVISDDDAGTNAGAAYLVEGPVTASMMITDSFAKILNQTAYTSVQTVSMPGDITNDGYQDIIIGSPYDDRNGNNTGTLFVVDGPVTGNLDLDTITIEIWGTSDSDAIGGNPVVGPGDVNGDGIDDLLIGNQGNDTAAAEAGAVYLVTGPITASMDLADADNVIYGEEASHQAGKAVVLAGDTNGDGLPDILVGATGADTLVNNGGSCYIFYDPTSITTLAAADIIVAGSETSDSLGSDMAMDTDLDGDGNLDLLVGATGHSDGASALGGVGLVFYGPLSGGIVAGADADHRFYGSGIGDAAGSRVAWMTDHDGAGSPAMVLTATGSDYSANDAGGVFLFFNLGM